MEQGQALGGVHWNEHLHQELFVLRLQRQGKAVDDAAERGHREGQQSHGCLTGGPAVWSPHWDSNTRTRWGGGL